MSRKITSAAFGTRYFRGPFPFEANVSPYEPQADEINSKFSTSLFFLFSDNVNYPEHFKLFCMSMFRVDF